MRYGILLAFIPLLFAACERSGERAQKVIDAAMEEHGTELLEKDTLVFRFREHRYRHAREDGRFHYEREPIEKSSPLYRDVLNNEGLTRYRDGKEIPLKRKDSLAAAEALNSVIYFAFLPYRLNDPAAIKHYEGLEKIEGQEYHRIRVSFEPEGGGKDHEDVFLYWFDKESKRMDYLAYRFFTDGGGVRFREAFDRRRVEGLLIQDYHNYKAPKETELQELPELWKEGKLEKVSEIRMKNVRVE